MERETAEKITIHITGDIAPDRLSAGELGELLNNLEDSIVPIVRRDSPSMDELGVMSLLAIETGSLSLAFSAPPAFVSPIRTLVSCFSIGDLSSLPEKSRRAVVWLSKWSRGRLFTLDWRIGAERIGSISPTLEVKFTEAPKLQGTTTLSGTVRSVGGERPSFKLRLAGGDLAVCTCDEDLARQCGKFLYRKVVVEGVAKNNILTGEMESFEASAVVLSERKLLSGIESIREKFGSVFDAIDPEAYMAQVRGD